MHPSIEQYRTYPYTKLNIHVTVKTICYNLTSFVALCERTPQRTSDPVLLQFKDLHNWHMFRDKGLALLRGYWFCTLVGRLLVEHPATEVKHISTEPLAPKSLSPHSIDAMLWAHLREHNAIQRVGI